MNKGEDVNQMDEEETRALWISLDRDCFPFNCWAFFFSEEEDNWSDSVSFIYIMVSFIIVRVRACVCLPRLEGRVTIREWKCAVLLWFVLSHPFFASSYNKI